jgi:hypothetical protein
MLLDRETATLVTEDDVTEKFEYCPVADECYFGTLLQLKGYPVKDMCVQKKSTWVDWPKQGPHPKTYKHVSRQVAGDIASSGAFFARKFAKGSNIGSYVLHKELNSGAAAAVQTTSEISAATL